MNSISEISWARDSSIFAEVLNLKGGTLEKKGPCPVCGGQDRFWIRPGRTQPMIFGCRQGCDFSDIMRALERRGLIESKKLSPEKVKQLRMERKVGYEAYIWALTIVEIGSAADAEYAKAQAVLQKAKKNGVEPLPREWAWKIAQIREQGLINEHR